MRLAAKGLDGKSLNGMMRTQPSKKIAVAQAVNTKTATEGMPDAVGVTPGLNTPKAAQPAGVTATRPPSARRCPGGCDLLFARQAAYAGGRRLEFVAVTLVVVRGPGLGRVHS